MPIDQVYKRGKKFDLAKKLLNKSILIKPDHAEAHYNLGLIFAELKKFQKAINYYQKAIEIEPSYINAHQNLMDVCEKTNQITKLKDAVSNARTFFKDNSIIKL